MERFHELYEQPYRQEIRLPHTDETHIHRDLDLGYTWARRTRLLGV